MSRAHDTREALLSTAQRMFAERGIDAVSLREIGAAAGQRNKTAAQYHFGSKDQLVRAIFERHTECVNRRRLELLAALDADDSGRDLHRLVTALVQPLAEKAVEPGSCYLRFMVQVSLTKWVRTLPLTDQRLMESMESTLARIAQQLDRLPPFVLRARLGMAMTLVIRTLAEYEDSRATDADGTGVGGAEADRTDADGAEGGRRAALLTANLIDAVAGMLVSPVSAATAALLGESPEDAAEEEQPQGWAWRLPSAAGGEGHGSAAR
ncbi:helix-turn-helix domain-containing protein [Streptomyces sp. NPDC000410]|uniref:TetR/AcrR family transcriptional regulator n=1 Tax=Streptomyces sp. NPDC000410 TaxID=3154254 RepID=UPI003319AD80